MSSDEVATSSKYDNGKLAKILVWILALTSALLIAGYLLYTFVLSNIISHYLANDVRNHITSSWKNSSTHSNDSTKNAHGFALIYIPRLRNNVWALPVLQGVTANELNAGFGHYTNTAMPGNIGNFAIAAHRATHGEPLAHVEQLKAGDLVEVETKTKWFTYVLDKDAIVAPDAMWVTHYPPSRFPSTPTKPDRLITLITCNPRWGSSQRWIWWGHLLSSRPTGRL